MATAFAIHRNAGSEGVHQRTRSGRLLLLVDLQDLRRVGEGGGAIVAARIVRDQRRDSAAKQMGETRVASTGMREGVLDRHKVFVGLLPVCRLVNASMQPLEKSALAALRVPEESSKKSAALRPLGGRSARFESRCVLQGRELVGEVEERAVHNVWKGPGCLAFARAQR